MADKNHKSTSEREFHRGNAREEVAKRWFKHAQEQGSSATYEQVRRHVNERADICDKKRDWR